MPGRTALVPVLVVTLAMTACSTADPGGAGTTAGTTAPASDGIAPDDPAPTGPPAIATAVPAAPVEAAEGEKWTNPGWVVDHGGELHMFRNSFSAWPGASVTHHLTSQDGGVTWTPSSPDPVWTNDAVPFGRGGNAFLMSGDVDGAGVWVAWFYTYNGTAAPGDIGRATAPAPTGPWTVDPDPVLSPGPEGAWDDTRVAEPHVVRTAGGYRMWYAGANRAGRSAIGLATSTDGISWVKHDDPTTAEPPFAESDPVLQGGQEWDDESVDGPRVLSGPDGSWVMLYDAASRGAYASGLASSVDGVTWEPSPFNPIMDEERSPDGDPFFQSAVVGGTDEARWFLEVGRPTAGTRIHPYDLDLAAAFPEG